MNYWKLGCRWYSYAPLFYNYLFENNIVLSWTAKEFQINDIVLLTDGFTSLGLAIVKSNLKSLNNYTEHIDNFKKLEIPTTDKNLLVFEAEFFPINDAEKFDYKLQGGIRQIQKQSIKKLISKIMSDNLESKNIEENIELLKYKKQIILQGPPGTGKTRLAKEIALKMIGSNNDIDLNNFLKKGISIPNASGAEDYYLLENVTANSVELSSERATKKWSASFNKIQEKLSQLKNGEVVKNKGGDDPYVLAVAKYVFKKLANNSKLLEDNEQFKLIQFHPSYTYEDFVRGIVAKPNEEGSGIIYDAENKTLGAFAKTANANYLESTNNRSTDIVSDFKRFVDYIIEEIDEKEKFMISDNIFIFYVDEKRFKYKGDNWTAHPNGLNMNFAELQKIISLKLNSRKEINKSEYLNSLTRQHATYYHNLIELYRNFILENPVTKEEKTLKNYILVIDEINRANLSSVLGELIYALEYRGEEVESMYEVEGSQKLILPPNLYIIGTMNTADRSVGHIDYAIRRRFAFVEILPTALIDNKEIYFNTIGYNLIANLFNSENVSPEFEIQDVQIGHSYFIAKKSEANNDNERDEIFTMKMQYEVLPILEEYVKDGILVGKVGELSIRNYIRSLKK